MYVGRYGIWGGQCSVWSGGHYLQCRPNPVGDACVQRNKGSLSQPPVHRTPLPLPKARPPHRHFSQNVSSVFYQHLPTRRYVVRYHKVDHERYISLTDILFNSFYTRFFSLQFIASPAFLALFAQRAIINLSLNTWTKKPTVLVITHHFAAAKLSSLANSTQWLRPSSHRYDILAVS